MAWVTERKDVLSGMFFMLTLAAYAGYVLPSALAAALPGRFLPRSGWGLMAKPMLVTLPFLLLLLDYWPLGRWANRIGSPANVEETGAATAAAEAGQYRRHGRWGLPAARCWRRSRAGNGGGLLRYDDLGQQRRGELSAGKRRSPVGDSATRPSPRDLPGIVLLSRETGGHLSSAEPRVAVLEDGRRAAAAGRRDAGGDRLAPQSPLPAGGLAVVSRHARSVSGVLQVGMQAVADRFTYLPQIGLCVALAWGAADLVAWQPRLRMAGHVAAVLLLAVLAGCAWRQTSFWHDNPTLWKRTLACTAANKLAHNSLGNAYLDLQQFDQAIEQYRAAIAIDPAHAMSHFNLGVALAATGRLDQAIAEYEEVVRLQPGHAAAHNNLGNALLNQNRLAAAMDHCQEALKIDPQFAEAHYNAGESVPAGSHGRSDRGAPARARSQSAVCRGTLSLGPDSCPARPP